MAKTYLVKSKSNGRMVRYDPLSLTIQKDISRFQNNPHVEIYEIRKLTRKERKTLKK